MNSLISSHSCQIVALVATSWLLKLLLIPAYYSTDFAVHQNWLRITHSRSLSDWYFDTQSKWTLDYPPLFAFFQYVLSIIASSFDISIVATINQSPQTIYFQRVSVILTDLLYLWVILKFSNNVVSLKTVVMYLWIPFIILDNIHFQYNLMMQALLIASVGFMSQQKYLAAAFSFSLLLNFKHIYLYCAPAFFVYILKQYVLIQKIKTVTQLYSTISRLLKVAIVTIIPFIISFGPFIIIGGFKVVAQIFTRLFPFSRGLIHEYWAPNFWALYYFLDKLLFAIGIRSSSKNQMHAVNSLKILPEILPSTTIIIILCFLVPIIAAFLLTKKQVSFSKLVSLCGFIFFMFGFHVHEKAIVPYVNLLFLFETEISCINAAIFVNIVNLIPLLIQPKEKSLSLIMCLIWIAVWNYIDKAKRQKMRKAQENFIKQVSFANARQMGLLYIQYFIQVSGLILVIFYLFIHPILKKPSLQFLPYMLNSVWASLFNLAWIGYLYQKFIEEYGIKGRRNINQLT